MKDKECGKSICLKALVDTENKKVIFVESNEEFIDVIFSFLTMPMGTITRLIRNQPPKVGIGCMNNLYESIENIDVQFFRTEACKNMLLYPRNWAMNHCNRLKWNIDDSEPLRYFLSANGDCTHLSHYRYATCDCGERMDREFFLSEEERFVDQDRGVFVKEQTQFMITDELQVLPPSTEASLSLFSKLGLNDGSITDECNLDIGVHEVLTLLKISLVSKTPLTETFLKHSPAPEFDQTGFDNGSYIKSRMEEPESNVNGKISIKLVVSKSKKIVCYAEGSEDFVDLLFSFLTVPLGYIMKEMQSNVLKGCINHLYNSIHELDAERFLKSNEHRAMLLNPKLAPNFSYENNPLGIEEDKHPPYYYAFSNFKLISNRTPLPSEGKVLTLNVVDPKSTSKDATKGGFVRGPKMFIVTDNLIITPMSIISRVSLLKKLMVPFSDIETHLMNVGSKEASRLLVASFVSDSALTNCFLRGPNPEHFGPL